MQEPINQKISLLLDDELDSREALALWRSIDDDAALKKQLQRYQLISSAMKNRNCVALSSDFAAKVHQQLAQEPSYLLPLQQTATKSVRSINWQKTGLALAASGLLAAMWLSDKLHRVQPGVPTLVYNLQQQQTMPASVNPRLNEYLQAHDSMMYSNSQARPSLPYARTVDFHQE